MNLTAESEFAPRQHDQHDGGAAGDWRVAEPATERSRIHGYLSVSDCPVQPGLCAAATPCRCPRRFAPLSFVVPPPSLPPVRQHVPPARPCGDRFSKSATTRPSK